MVWATSTTVEDALVSGAGTITARGTVASGQSAPDSPTVASDGAQRLAFAWTEVPGPTIWINVARQTIGRAPTVATVSRSGVDNPIGLVMSGAGRTTVVWTEMRDNLAEVIDAGSAAWGHGFGARQRLSDSGKLAIPGGGVGGSRGVGIDNLGRVSAIWVEGDISSAVGGGRVRVATSTSSGRFQLARTLQTSADPWMYERPAIAVSASGAVIATWARDNTEAATVEGRIWASAGSAGGQFSRPAVISPNGGDAASVAAVDRHGGAVAVWHVCGSYMATWRIQVRRWTPD